MPKISHVKSSGRNALLTVAAVSAVALAQGLLAHSGAAQVPGSIVVAQNQPKCGQDPQHPCPKPGQQQGQQQQQQQQQQQHQNQQGQQGQPNQQGQKLEERKGPPIQQGQQGQQGQPNQQGQKLEERKGPIQQGQQGQPIQQGQQGQQGQPNQQGQKLEERKLPIQQGQQGQQQQQGQQGQKPVFQGQPIQQGQQGQQQQRFQQGQQGQQGQPPKQTFQLVRPPQGQQGQNGPVFGNVKDLQQQRHEHTEAGGRIVIEEPDHRQIVREGGQAFVRHDENERLLMFGEARREHRRDGDYSIIVRPDGYQIITVTDDEGRLLRRFRRDREGHEFILIDNQRPIGAPIFLTLPLPVITIPQNQYIVDTGVVAEPIIYDTLMAPPLVPIERPYSLDEIRYNVALRDRMRRIDVDTINFDFGSWGVSPDQVERLQLVAQAMQDIIGRNPNEVFLVEGHTDAVGNDVDNLSLSDRRAETVAGILTQTFQIPPENMTTQGYGSHFLKIQTPEANRQNRRVTIRRITPLLTGANS